MQQIYYTSYPDQSNSVKISSGPIEIRFLFHPNHLNGSHRPGSCSSGFSYHYVCYESCWNLVLWLLGFAFSISHFLVSSNKPNNIETTRMLSFKRGIFASKDRNKAMLHKYFSSLLWSLRRYTYFLDSLFT